MENFSIRGPNRKRARSRAPTPEGTRLPDIKYEHADALFYTSNFIPFEEPETASAPINKANLVNDPTKIHSPCMNDSVVFRARHSADVNVSLNMNYSLGLRSQGSANVIGLLRDSDSAADDLFPADSQLEISEEFVNSRGSLKKRDHLGVGPLMSPDFSRDPFRHFQFAAPAESLATSSVSTSNEPPEKDNLSMAKKPPPEDKRGAQLVRAALRSFNFKDVTISSVKEFSQKLNNYTHDSSRLTPLGCFQSKEYYFQNACGVGAAERFKRLDFKNVKDTVLGSSRVALRLGRLVASHHSQVSRWVVFFDESHQFWALYVNETSRERKFPANEPYNKSWDTAFGANFNHKAVLIGTLAQIPMDKTEIPKPIIIQLEWADNVAPLKDDRRSHLRIMNTHSTNPQQTKAPAGPSKSKIHPDTIVQLLSMNTSFLKVPSYTQVVKGLIGHKKPLHNFQQMVRYVAFCEAVDEANKDAGIVVGRALMEAAWSKVVIEAVKDIYDGQNWAEQSKYSGACLPGLGPLDTCFSQVYSQDPFSVAQNV